MEALTYLEWCGETYKNHALKALGVKDSMADAARKAVNEEGASVSDVAKATGASEITVREWLKGSSRP